MVIRGELAMEAAKNDIRLDFFYNPERDFAIPEPLDDGGIADRPYTKCGLGNFRLRDEGLDIGYGFGKEGLCLVHAPIHNWLCPIRQAKNV